VEGTAQISGTPGLLEIALSIAPPYNIKADGSLRDLLTSPTWDLSAHTPILSPALFAKGIENIPALRDINIVASGGAEEATIESLALSSPGGRIRASGSVSWSPTPFWEGRITADDLDPGAFFPEWKGHLTLDARFAGRIKDGKPEIEVDIDHTMGVLHSRPIEIKGGVTWKNDRAGIRDMEIRSGTSRLFASGWIGTPWDLNWELDARDLSDLLPDASGRVKSRGRISGAASSFAITGDLLARKASHAWIRADRIDLAVDVSLSEEKTSCISLNGRGIVLAGRLIPYVSVDVLGTTLSHHGRVQVTTPEDKVTIDVLGRYADGSWEGTAQDLDVSSRMFGDWDMERPARLRASGEKAEVSGLVMGRPPARVALNGSYLFPDGAWSVASTLTAFPIGRLDTPFQNVLTLAGTVDARIQADGVRKKVLHGMMEATASGGSITLPGADGIGTVVPMGAARLTASLDRSKLTGEILVDLERDDSITGKVKMTHVDMAAGPGAWDIESGSFKARFSDLGRLGALPHVESLAGRILADVNFSGPVLSPRIQGTLRLEGGTCILPELGIRVREISCIIDGAPGEDLTISADASSGTGAIHIEGTIRPVGSGSPSAALHVTGTNFEGMRTPEILTILSPDVSITVLPDKTVGANGEIAIPKAFFKPAKGNREGIRPSPDVIIVGTGGKRPSQWNYSARIRLALGEEVSFEGYGLSSRITGGLLVTAKSGKSPLGNGELRLEEATYSIYGQKFPLESGRLIYAGGPLDEPGLDIRIAKKTQDNVTAGLRVTGTVSAPRMTLFSDPALSQDEILSYLVLGKPLRQATGEDGKLLKNALDSLAIAGGERLSQRIGRLFGIEDVEIQSGEEGLEHALVTVGTYLSPRLYASYGRGIVDELDVFRIRYEITPRLFIETVSGAESGGDITYRIER